MAKSKFIDPEVMRAFFEVDDRNKFTIVLLVFFLVFEISQLFKNFAQLHKD